MEKWKENKIKYNNNYNIKNYTRYQLRLRKGSKEEIWLQKQANKNGYLTSLILKDMEKSTKK